MGEANKDIMEEVGNNKNQPRKKINMKHPLADTHIIAYQTVITNDSKSFIKLALRIRDIYSSTKDGADRIVRLKQALKDLNAKKEDWPTILNKSQVKGVVPLSEEQSISRVSEFLGIQENFIDCDSFRKIELFTCLKSIIVFESAEGREKDLPSSRDVLDCIGHIDSVKKNG